MYYVFEGKEKYFRILTKGATLEIDTYTVHKWIAKDYDTGKALFLNRQKTYTPPTGTNAKKPANVYVTIPRELHTKFICLDNDICGTQQSNVGHARARGYQFCAPARQFPARNFQGKDIKIAKQELEIWKSKENREKENSRFIEHKTYSSKRIRLIYRSVLSLTKRVRHFSNTVIYWLVWLFATFVRQRDFDCMKARHPVGTMFVHFQMFDRCVHLKGLDLFALLDLLFKRDKISREKSLAHFCPSRLSLFSQRNTCRCCSKMNFSL